MFKSFLQAREGGDLNTDEADWLAEGGSVGDIGVEGWFADCGMERNRTRERKREKEIVSEREEIVRERERKKEGEKERERERETSATRMAVSASPWNAARHPGRRSGNSCR